MKTSLRSRRFSPAFTLVEMTIVLLVVLALARIGFTSSRKMTEWKAGRAASETLRSVYTAQRLYLADNPTADVATINGAQIVPYLSNGAAALPTVQSLAGTALAIIVNVSPPIINAGAGVRYDPSGSTTDSLWDVGE